mmetsp:Transcript_29939/g.89028  ORF Transcript_29939/g.89028 Transcript_29939/m.89028 type:complete len:276 (-) Transcript_29939:554-1381(-)
MRPRGRPPPTEGDHRYVPGERKARRRGDADAREHDRESDPHEGRGERRRDGHLRRRRRHHAERRECCGKVPRGIRSDAAAHHQQSRIRSALQRHAPSERSRPRRDTHRRHHRRGPSDRAYHQGQEYRVLHPPRNDGIESHQGATRCAHAGHYPVQGDGEAIGVELGRLSGIAQLGELRLRGGGGYVRLRQPHGHRDGAGQRRFRHGPAERLPRGPQEGVGVGSQRSSGGHGGDSFRYSRRRQRRESGPGRGTQLLGRRVQDRLGREPGAGESVGL